MTYSEYLIGILPDYSTLTLAQKNVLGDGKGKYSKTVLISCGWFVEQ
jgi:hypothetical protein